MAISSKHRPAWLVAWLLIVATTIATPYAMFMAEEPFNTLADYFQTFFQYQLVGTAYLFAFLVVFSLIVWAIVRKDPHLRPQAAKRLTLAHFPALVLLQIWAVCSLLNDVRAWWFTLLEQEKPTWITHNPLLPIAASLAWPAALALYALLTTIQATSGPIPVALNGHAPKVDS